MFLMKEKDSTTKLFDDDERIRSLTKAQAVTVDIPEERITHSNYEVESQKSCVGHPDGGGRAKLCLKAAPSAQ